MASWMRLEPREIHSIDVDALDLAAYGLWMWLSWRSWDSGGIPDDPQVIRRALRGRIDGAAFDEAWRQVRSLLDVDADGKLRVPWVENAREETIGMLNGHAARQREYRKRQKATAGPKNADRDANVTRRDSHDTSHARTDGRTDGQDKTDGQTNPPTPRRGKRAPPAEVEALWPASIDCIGLRVAWDDYLAYRRERRLSALAPSTVRQRFATFEVWGVEKSIQAIREAIAAGWQGIFEPKAPPAGTIQSGPLRGQRDGRAWLEEMVNGPAQPPARETTARVVDP